jgi:hypothetical protein
MTGEGVAIPFPVVVVAGGLVVVLDGLVVRVDPLLVLVGPEDIKPTQAYVSAHIVRQSLPTAGFHA